MVCNKGGVKMKSSEKDSRRPVVKFDEEIMLAKGKIPATLKLSKKQREARPRSKAKKRALVRAVAAKIKEAQESGYLIKTEKGFKLSF